MKFYQCEHCGNLAVKLTDSGVPMVCCGAPMTEVIPGTRDAAVEKHVPILHQNGMDILIEVGQISHPMSPEHRILWIVLETNLGFHVHYLTARDSPSTTFRLDKYESIRGVYSACNLHGIWESVL